MVRSVLLLALLCVPPVLAHGSDTSRVNGSIHVASGEHAGDLSTVNGGIDVGHDARADDISTVNGRIRLDDAVTAGQIETVNGSIDIGAGTSVHGLEAVNGSIRSRKDGRIAGDVTAVNGAITLAQGTTVGGAVENVNGDIDIAGTVIDGRVKTVSGDIDIGRGSHVRGGLLVDKPSGWHSREGSPPRIVIGPDAGVEGSLVFKREVELYVSERATVGPIEGATPVRFSGERP
jgi:hypothetical protein